MPDFPKEGSNTANMKGSEFYGYGNAAPTQNDSGLYYASPVKQEKHFLERKPTIPQVGAPVPPPSSGKEGTVNPVTPKTGTDEPEGGIKEGAIEGLFTGEGSAKRVDVYGLDESGKKKRQEERGE